MDENTRYVYGAARCSSCGRTHALTNGGTLYRHYDYRRREHSPSDVCPGSGLPGERVPEYRAVLVGRLA